MRRPIEGFRLAVFAVACALARGAALAAPAEKQLARVRGTVQYQTAPARRIAASSAASTSPTMPSPSR